MNQCEACETEVASVIEPCDDKREPYQLCELCHDRLLTRALRPLEWYNLAKRHGWWQHLLHDDFYLEDGTADQPELDVVDAKLFPSPTLSEVQEDSYSLLEYSITRWDLDDNTRSAWKNLPTQDILSVLKERFTATVNSGIRAKILEVCAASVGTAGVDFVQYAWEEYPEGIDLISLAEASASCLSFQDGYDRVVGALEALPSEKDKIEVMFSLGFFYSPRTLDWIEKNICPPITESWGYLAAASSVDWTRLRSWIKTGRPLSLVAIDTLRAIQRLPTPFLKKRRIRLFDPPSEAELRELLNIYIARDPVPRVTQRIEAILNETNKITEAANN